jgi:hypothetical protein
MASTYLSKCKSVASSGCGTDIRRTLSTWVGCRVAKQNTVQNRKRAECSDGDVTPKELCDANVDRLGASGELLPQMRAKGTC